MSIICRTKSNTACCCKHSAVVPMKVMSSPFLMTVSKVPLAQVTVIADRSALQRALILFLVGSSAVQTCLGWSRESDAGFHQVSADGGASWESRVGHPGRSHHHGQPLHCHSLVTAHAGQPSVPAHETALFCSLTCVMHFAHSCSVSCAAMYCTAPHAGDVGPLPRDRMLDRHARCMVLHCTRFALHFLLWPALCWPGNGWRAGVPSAMTTACGSLLPECMFCWVTLLRCCKMQGISAMQSSLCFVAITLSRLLHRGCLVQAGSREIKSCLCDTSKGMKRALLEAVATGAVASGGDVKRFKDCTLLQATVGDEVSS